MLCAIQLEILVRELDGILYQTLHLAANGLPTLLGDRMVNEYINNEDSPLIYFDSDQQEATNSHVLRNDGIVINLNCEGQGFADDPTDMQKNFAKVINHTTKICLWGNRQKEILASLIPSSRKDALVTTGYPSFDLLQPKFQPFYHNESISRQHGDDYILINTSFSMFNHEMGFDYYVKMLSRMDEWKIYGTPEYQKSLRQRCDHQEKTALALIELAQILSRKYPKRHIIIRPHPGENSTFYSEKVKKHENIFVTKEYSAREWIANAGAVIHHDCTTGMEAMLMGKNVIQFEPYKAIEGSALLMTQIGHKSTSITEALQNIEHKNLPTDIQQNYMNELAPYLNNINSNAARKIAQLAANLAGTDKPTGLPKPLGLIGQAKCWRKYVSKLLRARQPGRNGRKVRYALNKFPRLRKEEVVDKLKRLREVEPELPEVSVEQLCLNTFLIKPL